jgi:hypothetical protein
MCCRRWAPSNAESSAEVVAVGGYRFGSFAQSQQPQAIMGPDHPDAEAAVAASFRSPSLDSWVTLVALSFRMSPSLDDVTLSWLEPPLVAVADVDCCQEEQVDDGGVQLSTGKNEWIGNSFDVVGRKLVEWMDVTTTRSEGEGFWACGTGKQNMETTRSLGGSVQRCQVVPGGLPSTEE